MNITSRATRLGALITGALMMCTASGAQAGLIGVKEIVITNSAGVFLQISEVVAIQSSDGVTDAALGPGFGNTATLAGNNPGNGFGANPAAAINGVGPEAFANIFHSTTQGGGENMIVVLNTPTELDSFEIFGRVGGSSNDVYDVIVRVDPGMGGGLVDALTFTNLNANNSANSTGVISFVTSVPEPGTLALFGLGLAGLGVARRRRVV